jgi:uncharacterized protein YdeI (YjbR/CyaY-like superfamily)
MLEQLRAAIHAGCPDVEETIKWSVPHFDYKGIFCSLAAFKQHVRLLFWKAPLLRAGLPAAGQKALDQLDRMTSLDDVPNTKTVVSLVRAAAKLNDEGVRVIRPKPAPKRPVVVPPSLKAALAKHPSARSTFEAFSPSHKREYVEWISEAKTDETRERRIAKALEQMTEGKSRHWKYQRP